MTRVFEERFWEIARRESLLFDWTEPGGTKQPLVFRELYCDVRGCDCRRVELLVVRLEDQQPITLIHYDFDSQKSALDPDAPHTKQALHLFDWFTHTVTTYPECRARLIRHYELMKETKPRKTKAPKTVAGSQDLERVIAKVGGTESKAQQRFRKLLAKVEGLRQRLGLWTQHRADIDREVALYRVAYERHSKLGYDMVLTLDRAHASDEMTKAERKKLAAFIIDLAEMMLARGGHAGMKEIYNRYAQTDFDAELAAAEADEAEAMRVMVEDELGIFVGDEDAGSVERLRAAVRAQLDARDEEELAKKARRKKTSKQAAAEARREDEKKSADKAVQEIYRALARALHPDHESDPDERARKTRLMSEVNVAYEAKDLLKLLALQLELENVDAERAGSIAEEKLLHFARVLDEQAKQIAAELAGVEMPYRMELGLSPAALVTPERVILRIRADVSAVEVQTERHRRDLATFADRTLLKQWLRAQTRR